MIAFSLLLLIADANSNEARAAVDKYAACIVQQNGYRVRPLLDQPVGDKGEGARWIDVLKTKCIDQATVGDKFADQAQMRFSPLVIRGAVFEALLAKDYGNVANVDSFDEVTSVKYAPQGAQPSSAEAAYALAMDIGECTVRKATGASYAFLATTVGAKDERAATKTLVPIIGTCTPSGVTMEFSMSVIRGMIAEPMYRLTKAKMGAQE
jgi:hypothetical protein